MKNPNSSPFELEWVKGRMTTPLPAAQLSRISLREWKERVSRFLTWPPSSYFEEEQARHSNLSKTLPMPSS